MNNQPDDKDISWQNPNDDSNEPIDEYNDYVTDDNLQPDQQSDDALLDSGYLKEPKKRISFKENWEKVDETCPQCGNVTNKVQGLTRQNVKKLFTFQTDVQSLTILFLLIMCGAFAFTTYTFMTSTCNSTNATIIPVQELNTPLDPMLTLNLSEGLDVIDNITEVTDTSIGSGNITE